MARAFILAASAFLLGVAAFGTPGPATADDGKNSQGKTVFVTSQIYNGDLGGLQGADQKCQALAKAAHLKGTYLAWLSDTTASPSTRFVKSKAPYKLVDGTVIATSWADLTDGTLQHPINLTELRGAPAPTSPGVWTGTNPDGTAYMNPDPSVRNCSNWSTVGTTADPVAGLLGDTNANTGGNWTSAGALPCEDTWHLYCFQQ